MKKEVLIFLSISVSFVMLIGFFFFLSPNKLDLCNDGTPYNNCSSIKPYFCLNGYFVERPSVCGCGDLSQLENGKCFSKYQDQPKNITLIYTLRGQEGKIDFVVYKNLSNYLSKIPRYIDGYDATLSDFKIRSLDEPQQRELLLPLVVAIENITANKDDQVRIAISIVQNILFGNANKSIRFGDTVIDYYRYPYEVLYDLQGVCGEKSELLIFLIRELRYGGAFLYYNKENHESVGIKCPVEKSLNNLGYCFVETTGPSIITDSNTEYITASKLISNPEIIPITGDLTFGENNLYEYDDAKSLDRIRQLIKRYGEINIFQHFEFKNLVKKYGLITFEYTF